LYAKREQETFKKKKWEYITWKKMRMKPEIYNENKLKIKGNQPPDQFLQLIY
jgi:hypothetical protein